MPILDGVKSLLGRIWTITHPVWHHVEPYWEDRRVAINNSCAHLESWQVIFYSTAMTFLLVSFWNFLFRPDRTLLERLRATTFYLVRSIPYVRKKIAEELDKQVLELEGGFHKANKGMPYVQRIPSKGLSEEKVLEEMTRYRELSDVDWNEGACSGGVYSGEEKLTQLMTKVYADFAWTNPLHADVFPDIRKMEAEVVRMTCNLFNGGPDSCGTMTSGGSESLLLACLAYRNLAYSKGIRYPEIVLPDTAHAAFDKAASYFCIRLVHIPSDSKTCKVNARDMKRAITSRTCLLVGSAPHFPHGVIDPIEDIAKLGRQYNIPVHVDCCLGGFLVPFMKKAGFDVAPFDFSIPGVTSISADTHKYGLAPKGSSVIMYSSKNIRQFQYFCTPDWPGGIYASPTLAGSRAGALIAACWATMMFTGEDGYVEAARKIITTTRYIETEVRKIPGLDVLKSEASIVVIGSRRFNIYRLSDAMAAKGWHLNALQFPPSIHICCTLIHTKPGIAEKIVADFVSCTKEIMKDPDAKAGGKAAMYGLAQSIPDRSIVSEIACGYFDAYYSTGSKK